MKLESDVLPLGVFGAECGVEFSSRRLSPFESILGFPLTFEFEVDCQGVETEFAVGEESKGIRNFMQPDF